MLALGIGANTAIFSIVDAALLRPLPYPEPDELVMFSYVGRDGRTSTGASPRAFLDWRERQQDFDGIAAVGGGRLVLLGDGEPEEITVTEVSSDFFGVFGVQPLLGSFFGADAEYPGRDKVVVIGHGVWLQRFGATADVVGKRLKTDTGDYEVIGVLPPTFRYPGSRSPTAIVPYAFTQEDRTPGIVQSGFLSVEGRLKPGVTLEQAAARMTTLEAGLTDRRMAWNKERRIVLTSLHDGVTGASRSWMLMLLGSVAFVLFIACVNVANLFIAHGSDRARELTVRSALGASPSRLARLIFAESFVISVVGAVAGALLAWWAIGVIRTTTPGTVPRAASIALDLRVLGFTTICAIATAVVCGLVPAWRGSRIDLVEGLKEGSRAVTHGRSRQRLGQVLVFAEIAGAVILLVGAGLFISSFVRLMTTDPGFRTDKLVAMSVTFPNGVKNESVPGLARELLQRIAAVPGIENAAFSQNSRPFSVGNMTIPVTIEGSGSTERQSLIRRTVSPEYLDVLGVPIVRGRGIDWRDTAATPAIGVINESAARQLFPGVEPVGRRLRFNKLLYEIVGVVSDIRHLGLARAPEPEMFVPLAQAATSTTGTLTVRLQGNSEQIVPLIKSRVYEMSPDKPIRDILSLDETASRAAAPRRFNMIVLSIFAAVALAIAAIGIYGVMAHVVSRRTHEIGVRIALGARAEDVRRMILGQGAVVIAAGLATGIAGAWYLARTIESFLFEIRGHDLRVFAAAVAVLAIVGVGACWIPARRASRVDPLEALRTL
jgi:putative ABC transport system permease protein